MDLISSNGFTLGILGGGQLGRMLIQSAMNFNLRIHALDPDMNAPCKSICHEFTAGSLTDAETVYRFGSRCNLLTIEIENVNVDALERLHSEGVSVFPQPGIIRTLQDKGLQKTFLRDNGIPTADFVLLEGNANLSQHSARLPAVQKLRRMGYDGRGVFKISSAKQFPDAFTEPSILESFIDFEKEISVIIARSATGEIQSYPPTEMKFHPTANLVEFLVSPAKLSPAVQKQAEEIAVRIAEALGIVGIAAVEMFVTRDQTVLVNEIAPRVHNSGHHTIEANATSQFEQHLRAILGLPLGSTTSLSPAVMVNLLGEESFEGPARYEGLAETLAIEGAHLHLYGKEKTKPFRKMGHVTIVDKSAKSAMEKAEIIKRKLRVVA